MKNVSNPIVNELWQENLPLLYKKLLRDVASKCKLVKLLEANTSRFSQNKLSVWSDTVIEITEANFRTFAFTKLHF